MKLLCSCCQSLLVPPSGDGDVPPSKPVVEPPAPPWAPIPPVAAPPVVATPPDETAPPERVGGPPATPPPGGAPTGGDTPARGDAAPGARGRPSDHRAAIAGRPAAGTAVAGSASRRNAGRHDRSPVGGSTARRADRAPRRLDTTRACRPRCRAARSIPACALSATLACECKAEERHKEVGRPRRC